MNVVCSEKESDVLKDFAGNGSKMVHGWPAKQRSLVGGEVSSAEDRVRGYIYSLPDPIRLGLCRFVIYGQYIRHRTEVTVHLGRRI